MKRHIVLVAAVTGLVLLAVGQSARAGHCGPFGGFRATTVSPYAPGVAYGGRYVGMYPSFNYNQYRSYYGPGYGYPGYGFGGANGIGYYGPAYGGIQKGVVIQTPGFGLYVR